MKRLAAAALTATLLASGAAHAQDTRTLAAGAASPPASIDILKGMIGNWTTQTGAAGWSAPVGGEIVGHVILTDDKGAPRVQELWIFKAEGGSIVLHQKLFDGPGQAEREDKDKFEVRRLVAIEGGKLYFENMTLEPKGDVIDLAVNRPIGLLKIEYKRSK